MGGVTGSTSLKDSASATSRNLRSEQLKLCEDIKKTSNALKNVWGTPRKLKADVSDATRVLRHVTDAARKTKPVTVAVKAKGTATKVIKGAGTVLKIVGRPVTAVLKAKDTAFKAVKKTVGALDRLGRKMASLVVKVVDKTNGAIKGIVGRISKAAKAVAIPVGIAAAAGTTALGASANVGMQLGQQQASIEHFVGATNRELSRADVKAQSQSYTQQLRENANATPFETGEIIQAGLGAISPAGGSTMDVMDLVTLTEDMVAASGGTTPIMDVIKALGDSKVGETERLKSFGFKVSAEELKKKGFSGASGELQDFFGGVVGKLAGSRTGLMSTITGKMKGNVVNFGLGVVEQLKSILSEVIGLMDGVQPALKKPSSGFGQGLGKGIGLAKTAFTQIVPIINSVVPTVLPIATSFLGGMSTVFGQIALAATMAITDIGPVIISLVPIIQQAASIVGAVVGGIGSAVSAVAPVVTTIMLEIGDKVSGAVEFLAKRPEFIHSVVETAGPAVTKVLETTWGVISPVMDILITTSGLVFGVIQKVWPGIQDTISGVWSHPEPIFDIIGEGVDLSAEAWSKVEDLVTGGGDTGSGSSGGGVSPGKNARGGNNWRGGPIWVGEKGPELIGLPKGTRILSSKESSAQATMGDSNIIQLSRYPVDGGDVTLSGGKIITVQIQKIADEVHIRNEDDTEEISERTAKKTIEELDNTA